jgi:hypothetical protein
VASIAPDRATVIAFPPGRRLYDVVRDAVAEHDPTLPADCALAYPEAVAGLPAALVESEALRWAWLAAPSLEGEGPRRYLDGIPGSSSGVPRDRLAIEERFRRVMKTRLVGEPGARPCRITGVPSDRPEPVEIDPELILTTNGVEREREELRRPHLLLTHVRIDTNEDFNPAQGRLPLESPKPALSKDKAIETALLQLGIVRADQPIPEAEFGKLVRKLAGKPDAEPKRGRRPPIGYHEK